VDNHAKPLPTRTASSVEILADRVRAVGRAWKASDEPAARQELRTLAAEAQLLAAMYPLPLGPSANRRRVAA